MLSYSATQAEVLKMVQEGKKVQKVKSKTHKQLN